MKRSASNECRTLTPARWRQKGSTFNIRLAVLFWFAAAGGAPANDDLTSLSDEFDDAASLGAWSRVVYTEGWGNDALEALDANTSRPGQLVMMPHTSSWYGEWRGELTYKLVTGDFVITTFVEPRNRAGTGRPERDYSLAGIMVRAPRAMTNATAWTPNGQNYVFLSLGAASRQTAGYEFEVKTTTNSSSTLFIQGINASRATIQVARIGPHVVTLRRLEGGEWVVHRRFHRPDFPATLQAGLTVYTDWDVCAAVGYANHNVTVLTNGAALPGGGTVAGAQPDLVAAFEYVRYARPAVPPELEDADLSNSNAVSDAELLEFLGEHANQPGGAAVPPVFLAGIAVTNLEFRVSASVVSGRAYRLQVTEALGETWHDAQYHLSTGALLHLAHPIGSQQTQSYYRLISP